MNDREREGYPVRDRAFTHFREQMIEIQQVACILFFSTRVNYRRHYAEDRTFDFRHVGTIDNINSYRSVDMYSIVIHLIYVLCENVLSFFQLVNAHHLLSDQ